MISIVGRRRPQGLNSLLKNSVARRGAPSAAKAGTENKAFLAAVNRCATQKQNQVQMQKPWQMLPWNPTLTSQKARR